MTQFLIDQELHENCVPREQHRAEVAAAEERGRVEGAVKERERIKNAATEFCRRCCDESPELVEPAAVILWGKLIPAEHLGPRCEWHAAEAIGWESLRPDRFEQWAGFDLRPFRASS